jgi:NADH dehydrogenase
MPEPTSPRIFIIGGGFAGLQVAKTLARARAQVTLVDRRNHHVFQPLLYQVATAALSPADIASPIRHILRKIRNCRVVLAELTRVDLKQRRLIFDDMQVEYDYLILAAGATHSYFGRDDWAPVAPGLKTLEDATELRRRLLLAFESAEYEGSDESRRRALTFAVVGGGPTGVELAGAIKEIAAQTIPADFRFIDTATTRVLLLQGADRLLPTYPPDLSERARADLIGMGVEVRLNARVTDISADGVRVGDEFIPASNVFWAAGVRASPISATLGVKLDTSGRVVVAPDLSIPGHPEVFVCGDLAAATSARSGKPVPGVAQAAIQAGAFVGSLLANELGAIARGRTAPARPAFSFFDKGNMATIGRGRAVAEIGRLHLTGLIAWLLWGLVHVMFLVGFRNRLTVMISWVWSYLIFSRDARLIIGDSRLNITLPRDDPVRPRPIEARA